MDQQPPRFELGRTVATPGALRCLAGSGQTPIELLRRHLAGDRGDLCAEDSARNDESVEDGCRVLSAYTLKSGEKVWVITEAVGDDGRRASTCVLLPEEY